MATSAYNDPVLNRKILVTDAGIVIEHPIKTSSDGYLVRTHFTALNSGGDLVFFVHGGDDLEVSDITTWTPLQAVISPTNAADETIYRATLGGVNFDYTSDPGDGDADIATGLVELIDANAAYSAEVVGSTCAVRSATVTPFTVATSIQGGAGGAGTIANSIPEYGADNVLLTSRECDEWTGANERMALVCESGGTATVFLRYKQSVAQPVLKAK
jgi:hypothetical protein